jgi:magnesium-protoporphyrin O-methyltransferase
VLEIGGGIGAIQAELLLKGAAAGEVIELVGAYEPYARRLATKLGLADRTSFRVADIIEDAVADDADVVVMNRVVCCSADGVRLTGVAAGLARRVLALSYPRSLAILRWAEWLQQPIARLFRRRYRFYIHDSRAIHRAATGTGMHLLSSWHGLFWEYSVFGRPDRAAADDASARGSETPARAQGRSPLARKGRPPC